MSIDKWSRKRWIAEQHSADIKEYDEYQPSLKGREKRLPIYTDGTLEVCVFPADSKEIVERTLEGRHWKVRKHWRNPEVTIYIETDAEGASPNFDYNVGA